MAVLANLLIGLLPHHRRRDQDAELAVAQARDQARRLLDADSIQRQPRHPRTVALRLQRKFHGHRVAVRPDPVATDGVATAVSRGAGQLVDQDVVVHHRRQTRGARLKGGGGVLEVGVERGDDRLLGRRLRHLLGHRAVVQGGLGAQRRVGAGLHPAAPSLGRMAAERDAGVEVVQPGPRCRRHVEHGEDRPVVLKALPLHRLPQRHQVVGGRNA